MNDLGNSLDLCEVDRADLMDVSGGFRLAAQLPTPPPPPRPDDLVQNTPSSAGMVMLQIMF